VNLCRQAKEAMAEGGWTGLMIGGTGAYAFDPTLTLRLKEAGLDEVVEAWNLHAYPFAMPAEAMLPRAESAAALAGARGYWGTELGIWGDDEDSPRDSPHHHWAGTELAAADRMVRASALLLAHGARKVFFAASSRPRYSHGFGADWLFTPSSEPRVSLPALAALSRRLGPTPAAAGVVEADWGTAYFFDTGGNAVGILCPRYGGIVPEGLFDGAQPPVLLYDLWGNAVESPPARDLPVYAELVGSNAAALRAMLEDAE